MLSHDSKCCRHIRTLVGRTVDRTTNMQGLDLSEWMRSHLRADDVVTLVVDLGGREHGLLAHLLRGGTLPLANQVLVHWHTQHLVSPVHVVMSEDTQPVSYLLSFAHLDVIAMQLGTRHSRSDHSCCLEHQLECCPHRTRSGQSYCAYAMCLCRTGSGH